MMLRKWKPTKVNGHWSMSRCEKINTVAIRPFTKWERIRYFWLKNDVTYKRTGIQITLDRLGTSSEFLCLCERQKGWITEGKWSEECPTCGRVYFGRYNPKTLHIEAIEQLG